MFICEFIYHFSLWSSLAKLNITIIKCKLFYFYFTIFEIEIEKHNKKLNRKRIRCALSKYIYIFLLLVLLYKSYINYCFHDVQIVISVCDTIVGKRNTHWNILKSAFLKLVFGNFNNMLNHSSFVVKTVLRFLLFFMRSWKIKTHFEIFQLLKLYTGSIWNISLQ